MRITRVIAAGWAVIADSVSLVYHLWEPSKRANDLNNLREWTDLNLNGLSQIFSGQTPRLHPPRLL